ncbi:MAG: gliding motility-associated protein GldE [Porphyromonas sp.]|nr:gliding motility-associated protein GldE [Porphyromonas sp.]
MDIPDPYLSSIFSGVVTYPLTFSSITALLLILLCLIFSALFSGTETAFYSLSPSQLDELRKSNDKRDELVLDILSNPNYFLGSILIGNSFVNTAIVMLSEYFVTQTFDFSNSPVVGFLLQVVAITFLILLFAEVIPKIYFQKNAITMARRLSGATAGLMSALKPFTKGLVRLGDWAAKPFQRSPSEEVTAEELHKAIDLTTDDVEEKGLLKEIVRFYQKSASEVMTPRIDIAGLEYDTPFNEVKEFIQDKGYSRIPVYDDHIDNIKGIIYAKDLIPHLSQPEDYHWQSLIRDAFFVPESKMINTLLEEFRQQKIHMAIVVDEFGGTSGLVTMEDLLEEIFGEIEDEYDDEEELYKINDDGTIVMDAKISLIDFLRVAKLQDFQEIASKLEEVDTVGGLLLEAKGDFPVAGEEIKIDCHTFRILEMGRRRISKVLFIPGDPSSTDREANAKDHDDARS